MAFVTVQGEYQITATNGETRKFPIGTVLLIEDTIGEGHMTKTSSTGNTIVFAVGLPPSEETAAAPRREGGHIEIGHDGDG